VLCKNNITRNVGYCKINMHVSQYLKFLVTTTTTATYITAATTTITTTTTTTTITHHFNKHSLGNIVLLITNKYHINI